MANPRTPAMASFPVPPPVPGWPLVDAKGMATPAFAQFLQLLWAAIQGTGGIIDITTQNIFEESPSFSPDTVAGKEPILAEMPESMAGSVPKDKTWLLAERSYADLYKRVSNAEVLAALGSVSSSKVADIKGTANQVIVSTAAGIYTLSTPQDIATTSTVRFGKVGVGMAAVNILDITDTQAGTAKVSILNGNNGVAAAAFLRAINDTGSASIIGINSSGFTPAGMDRASGSFVVGTGVGGLSCYTIGAQPVYFGTNGVQRMQVDSTRLLLSVLFQPPAYTVATLPGGSVGDIAYVTDATAPTYLAVLVGGGTVKTPVFYNGTAWVSF